MPFQKWDKCVEILDDGSKIASLRCIPVVLQNLVSAALLFVGVVAVILIIYSGIKFIYSGGDQKQVAAARQIMTYAILGLVLVLSSFGIIYFISYLTNVQCITKFDLTSCGP